MRLERQPLHPVYKSEGGSVEGLASGITSGYLPNLLSAQEASRVVEAGEAMAVVVVVAVMMVVAVLTCKGKCQTCKSRDTNVKNPMPHTPHPAFHRLPPASLLHQQCSSKLGYCEANKYFNVNIYF